MPRKKKGSKTETPVVPEVQTPPADPHAFPEFVYPDGKSPYNSQLRAEAETVIKEFDELTEEEIADDLRKQLWPHRQKLVSRMIEFSEQNTNQQVAERVTSKLVERIYGKIPTTKVELGEEERGLAVFMHPDIYTAEDDISDGTDRPEGFDDLDDDETALIQEDESNDPDDEEEDEEDEDQ